MKYEQAVAEKLAKKLEKLARAQVPMAFAVGLFVFGATSMFLDATGILPKDRAEHYGAMFGGFSALVLAVRAYGRAVLWRLKVQMILRKIEKDQPVED